MSECFVVKVNNSDWSWHGIKADAEEEAAMLASEGRTPNSQDLEINGIEIVQVKTLNVWTKEKGWYNG